MFIGEPRPFNNSCWALPVGPSVLALTRSTKLQLSPVEQPQISTEWDWLHLTGTTVASAGTLAVYGAGPTTEQVHRRCSSLASLNSSARPASRKGASNSVPSQCLHVLQPKYDVSLALGTLPLILACNQQQRQQPA